MSKVKGWSFETIKFVIHGYPAGKMFWRGWCGQSDKKGRLSTVEYAEGVWGDGECG